jgi:ribulose-phosphate 3-epimerase
LIEVDGGVKPNNIRDIAHSGADILVAGSAVFKAPDIPQRIEQLQKEAQIGKGTIVQLIIFPLQIFHTTSLSLLLSYK